MSQSKRPNILLIITDQERAHQHWPTGWAESNLPSYYNDLIGCRCESGTDQSSRSSVVFTHAFTATTECSPSRASLLTSSYPSEHGVTTTPGSLDPLTDYSLENHQDQVNNIHTRPNLLRLLSSSIGSVETCSQQKGYDVAWKGKWHLTPPVHSPENHKRYDSSILKWYGATSLWTPPDAGHSLCRSSTLGGGWKYNNDGRVLRGNNQKFNLLLKKQDLQIQRDNLALENIDVNKRLKADCGKSNVLPSSCSDSDDDSDENTYLGDKEESILDFLERHAKKPIFDAAALDNKHYSSNDTLQPFFLVASLVNPHDVWASACFSNLTDDEFFKETGYHPRDFESIPIELPPNHNDNLTTKPSIQAILKSQPVFGDLSVDSVIENDMVMCETSLKQFGSSVEVPKTRTSVALRYIRFYAYLHKQIDAEIKFLLEVLESTGQMENTIIIRTSDHGELALSHGMREKRMQCYDETMHVPLIFNYPSDYFHDRLPEDKVDGISCDCAVALNSTKIVSKQSSSSTSTIRTISNLVSSIDILPTIAELAGINTSRFSYRGKSLVPFLLSDCKTEDDEVLFTFDEPLAPPGIPGYIRCIRTSNYKYAVYFTDNGSSFDYELYDLKSDPYEMHNLCPPNYDPDERWQKCHDSLTRLMQRMEAIPQKFDWAKLSTPKMWTKKF